MLSATSGQRTILIVISPRKLNPTKLNFLNVAPHNQYRPVYLTDRLYKNALSMALQQNLRALLSDGVYRKFNADGSDSALLLSTIPSPNKRLALQ